MAAGAKRLMDVEDVITWACSQELPKKRPPSGRQLPAMDLQRGDGELVGRWTRPFGFPSISPMFRPGFGGGTSRQRGGEPDSDALIVEAAILALPPRIVGLEPPAALAEGIGLLPIDVAGAFAAAISNIVNIVLAYGRLGKRPALGDDPPAVRPRLAANGKPGVWIMRRELEPTLDGAGVERALEQPVKAIRKDVYAPGSFCRIDYDPDPQLIVNDRAEYLAWRLALEGLAAALSGALETIEPMAPAAALMPWLREADAAKPPDLFRPGADGVHGLQEAAAMAGERTRAARRPVRPGERRSGRQARPARGTATG